jgi:hypothetical protein
MTIIITLINRFGIVHGTDSNIRHNNAIGTATDQTTKLFSLGEKAAVTVAGNWHIDNGFSMDYWMGQFVADELSRNDFSLRTFARHLAEEWNAKIPAEKREPMGNWAHIAGYERLNNESHPEFWAVSNVTAQTIERPTAFAQRFGHWECLSTYDCRMLNHDPNKPIDLYALFADGSSVAQQYQNGHGDGRLLTNVAAFLHSIGSQLGVLMEDFLSRSPETRIAQSAFSDLEQSESLKQLIGQLGKVKTPTDIDSSAELVRRTIQVIGEAFLAREDEVVGGEPQLYKIAAPKDMCKTNRKCPIYSEHVINYELAPVFAE